jgi:hypothetical protein
LRPSRIYPLNTHVFSSEDFHPPYTSISSIHTLHTYIHTYIYARMYPETPGWGNSEIHDSKQTRVKLPTFTQLRATWHIHSLDMVVLPSTGASRYHNCCIDGGTSPEYFGCTQVHINNVNDWCQC